MSTQSKSTESHTSAAGAQGADSGATKKGTLKRAKNFKKTRPGTYLSLGTSAVSAITTIRRARAARGESDMLKLVDALVSVAAIATGMALLVRELRRMNNDDVLSG